MPIRTIPVAIAALAVFPAIPRAHARGTRTSNRTRFRSYTVQTRLESHDLDVETLRCRYAKLINASRSGSRTYETTARAAVSRSRPYTGDGAVDYNDGERRRHRGVAWPSARRQLVGDAPRDPGDHRRTSRDHVRLPHR